MAQQTEDEAGRSRAYRLERGEGVAEGIRRIGQGRAAHAMERLRAASDADFAASVHEARKDLKKLRSLLRLVRNGLGKQAYAERSARYRDAGRALSGARDAAVRLETLAALEDRFGDQLPGRAIAAFRRELEAERGEASGAAGLEAARDLIAEALALGDLRLPDGGWEVLEPGLRRSYRRGRQAMRTTRRDPSAANVHDWRKRIKDLWYHLRLVQESWPALLVPAAEEAHRLSELLGDHHDLAALGQRAGRSPAFSSAELGSLTARVEAAQEEVLREAAPIAERLYAERPKAFTKRIGSYWASWRAA
jgi:CHAD domain-containing protein